MRIREVVFYQQLILAIICLLLVTDHEAIILSSASTSTSTSTSTAPPMAKPGCDQYCGNISIPYPFGIGKRCYHNEWFSINCDNSFSPPKPFLNHSKLNLEALSVDMSSVTVNSPISSNCVNGEKNTTHSNWRSPDLTGSPFLYSSGNDLMAVGCVNVVLRDGDGKTTAGCTSVCNDSIIAKDCSLGINCCKASLFYESFDVYSLSTSAVLSGKELGCSYAFLAYNYTPSYNNISEIININAVGGNGSKYVPLELRWFFPEPVKFRSCSDGTVETSRRNYSYC